MRATGNQLRLGAQLILMNETDLRIIAVVDVDVWSLAVRKLWSSHASVPSAQVRLSVIRSFWKRVRGVSRP